MNKDIQIRLVEMKKEQRYWQKDLKALKESGGSAEKIEMYERYVNDYKYKIAHIQQIEAEFNAIRAIIQNSEFSSELRCLVRNTRDL